MERPDLSYVSSRFQWSLAYNDSWEKWNIYECYGNGNPRHELFSDQAQYSQAEKLREFLKFDLGLIPIVLTFWV